MRPRLDALLRTTTFRLALVQAGVVLSFVVALLIYVYIATVGQLLHDADVAADQEYSSLEHAYSEGGIRRLTSEVAERTLREGPMIYALAGVDGSIVAGDLQAMPARPGPQPTHIDFKFPRAPDSGSGPPTRGQARGKLGRLLGGPILLVGRDLGDTAVIAGRITQVLWTVAIAGIVFAVGVGLLASWQAARRAEALSVTARDVMAGDMSRRAPIRGAGDEFDVLAGDMNAMLDRIERLMITTRTAGDAIAHDLRSPLTRFQQKLEAALEAEPDSEADREALRKAVTEADRLLDMFAAVLKLARVETPGNWRFERVDVTEIVRELIEFYQPAAEEQGLGFKGEAQDGLTLRGDAGLITQALSNLIENALKYTPVGGHVEVRAQRNGDGRLDLAVSDDGPGVPPADRERVQERFVRLETARTSPGVGLGLSLVSAVARLHKGELKLREGLGEGERQGLTAELLLPSLEAARF